jgi:hypothetical protein
MVPSKGWHPPKKINDLIRHSSTTRAKPVRRTPVWPIYVRHWADSLTNDEFDDFLSAFTTLTATASYGGAPPVVLNGLGMLEAMLLEISDDRNEDADDEGDEE